MDLKKTSLNCAALRSQQIVITVRLMQPFRQARS
jgi:hypothetical protein